MTITVTEPAPIDPPAVKVITILPVVAPVAALVLIAAVPPVAVTVAEAKPASAVNGKVISTALLTSTVAEAGGVTTGNSYSFLQPVRIIKPVSKQIKIFFMIFNFDYYMNNYIFFSVAKVG